MNEAWQKWWATLRHPKTPVGSYNPLEDSMYEAFIAGWRASATQLPTVPNSTGSTQSSDAERDRISVEVREVFQETSNKRI
jgi:hypothetical protein